MELVATVLTCLFISFCAGDGRCTDDAPMQITVDFGVGNDPIRLWTTPDATGRPLTAEMVEPLPDRTGAALHLLARGAADGALLVSLTRNRADDGTTLATLRRHPDRWGNPTGPEAATAQATCTQSFRPF